MGPDPASLSFVDIVSYREDATALDLEHPLLKDGFDGLVKIQKDIATLIAKSRPAVWNNLDLSTEGGAPFAKYCNSRGDLKLPSVKEITKDDDFAPLDMVKEGECAMPSTFVALADGESVIASTSNLYNLTCCDKIKCLLTCGLYYCCVLRKKRAERQGFVLTTHRLLTISRARGVPHDVLLGRRPVLLPGGQGARRARLPAGRGGVENAKEMFGRRLRRRCPRARLRASRATR